MDGKIKSIIIESTEYKLKFGTNEKYEGLISFYPCEIFIKTECPDTGRVSDSFRLRTLFHEVCHAIIKHRLENMSAINEDMTEEEQETLINEIGNGFLNLLIMNPDLVEFVQDHSKELLKTLNEKGGQDK
jgi:hypothetical protein